MSLSSSCPLQCSKSCGGGHRRRALQCEDHYHRDLHEMYCANLIRPPDVESCNSQACEVVWITGEWTKVTVGGGASNNSSLERGHTPVLLPVM